MKRLTVLALAGAFAAPCAADPQWFLFSRHGECSSIAVLNRKLPDVGDAGTPDEIARRLRRRGETVEIVNQPAVSGEMVRMHLLKRRMSLIFVTGELCNAEGESSGHSVR